MRIILIAVTAFILASCQHNTADQYNDPVVKEAIRLQNEGK